MIGLSVGPLMAALLWMAEPGCPPGAVLPGSGVEDPFRAPAPAALQHNFDAKQLYREGKWEDARARYRTALAADPSFLPPLLNIACSFVRQERFAEATAEVVTLLERAHVPWTREILEAADLGALKVRPEMAQVLEAIAVSASAWSAELVHDLVFVARTKAPIEVGGPREMGVFILGLHQEVFAWSPRTGRYRQLTSEDGRVLAIARSPDGRRLAYVIGEKLVRSEGSPAALRGLSVRLLDLTSMSLSERAALGGDVWRIRLGFDGASALVEVRGDRLGGTHVVEEGRLRARPGGWPTRRRGAATFATVLTSEGVDAATPRTLSGPCSLTAYERRPADRASVIEIAGKGSRRALSTRFGAGLLGLALPLRRIEKASP